MPARRPTPTLPPSAGARDPRSDADAPAARRAPFSDNPRLGVRGLRTQQRILDAALRLFADEGYHRCSVERITKASGCSRVSFYQYFASKEDVFRHLAATVARQLRASTEALDPLTAELDGWRALRAWVGRYAEIYARYEPVLNGYRAVVGTDDGIAAAAAHTSEQTVARLHSRLVAPTLAGRHLDPVIGLLLECVNHTFDVVGILRSVAPDAHPDARVAQALADVVHRTLFGLRPGVNVHPPAEQPAAVPGFGPAARALLRPLAPGDGLAGRDGSSGGAREALLASARDVFVARGYHETRVDDLVAAAGVSHGAFYRHFRNTDELARVLTAQALQVVAQAVAEIPEAGDGRGPAGRPALRRWLRRYHAVHAHEAAMLAVWVDAALHDPTLRAESAPPLEWGRRRMAGYLRPRGFGDVDTEAIVMVALLGVFGARPRPAAEIEAAALVVERGLLGA